MRMLTRGVDKKVRDKAIKNLSVFLSDSEDALPPLELAKLWKGIFYCESTLAHNYTLSQIFRLLDV